MAEVENAKQQKDPNLPLNLHVRVGLVKGGGRRGKGGEQADSQQGVGLEILSVFLPMQRGVARTRRARGHARH